MVAEFIEIRVLETCVTETVSETGTETTISVVVDQTFNAFHSIFHRAIIIQGGFLKMSYSGSKKGQKKVFFGSKKRDWTFLGQKL